MAVENYCYLERHGSIKQAEVTVGQRLSFRALVKFAGKFATQRADTAYEPF